MNFIELLTTGAKAQPKDIGRVVSEVLLSDFSRDDAWQKYQEKEDATRDLFKALLSRRQVAQSTFSSFRVMHPTQYDLYNPISLSDGIVCYPMQTYENPQSIEGGIEALKAQKVQAVTSHAKRTYGGGVWNKTYGYLFATAPIDLSRGENALPTALEELEPDDIFTIERSNPGNWLQPFRIDPGMIENQEKFSRFTEELLVHEGHQQVMVWQ